MELEAAIQARRSVRRFRPDPVPEEMIGRMLEAAAHGLSSCFVGWLDVEKASELLGLPEEIRCLFLLPVGYADQRPAPRRLKPMEEIAFFDAYPGGAAK